MTGGERPTDPDRPAVRGAGDGNDAADDQLAVARTVYTYAYGIDHCDWELYRSIFAERIDVDFSSYDGAEAMTVTAEEWLGRVQPLFTGLDATQHTMSNPLVDLDADGERARCRMYMQAAHFLTDWPEPEFTIGGFYDDRLRRTADGWRITSVTLTVWWRRGDERLMAEAHARGRRRLRDRRDA
ncbi:MAG: nuclear transport factor 2 family protein [Actinomycetota bacterium]